MFLWITPGFSRTAYTTCAFKTADIWFPQIPLRFPLFHVSTVAPRRSYARLPHVRTSFLSFAPIYISSCARRFAGKSIRNCARAQKSGHMIVARVLQENVPTASRLIGVGEFATFTAAANDHAPFVVSRRSRPVSCESRGFPARSFSYQTEGAWRLKSANSRCFEHISAAKNAKPVWLRRSSLVC